MLCLLVSATNLEGKDSFFFDSLDLRDDIVVNPEDGNGKSSTPFVPKSRHTTLDGNETSAPGFGSHDRRSGMDDASGLLLLEDLSAIQQGIGAVKSPVKEEGRCRGCSSSSRAGEEEVLVETRNETSE